MVFEAIYMQSNDIQSWQASRPAHKQPQFIFRFPKM